MKSMLIYWLILSMISFIQFVLDKRRAIKGRWRISERTLLLTALLGGAPGALAGMYLVRHKTRHWYFRWGIPLFVLLQLALILYLGSRDLLFL